MLQGKVNTYFFGDCGISQLINEIIGFGGKALAGAAIG